MLATGAGKVREAESLLRETMELFPADPHARALLADDLQRVEDAREILKEAIVKGVADEATLGLKWKLERGLALRGTGLRPQVVERAADVLDLPSGAAPAVPLRDGSGEQGCHARVSLRFVDGRLRRLPRQSSRPVERSARHEFRLRFRGHASKAEPFAWSALLARARPSEKAIILEALEGAVDMKPINESALDGTDIDMSDAMDADPVRARSGSLPDIGRDARFRALHVAQRQRGGREDRRIRLFRDFAASSLSSGSGVSLLAA